MERLALPAIRAFKPDVLIIACGFDPSAFDPLSRMLASAETFRTMTRPGHGPRYDDICGRQA